MKPARTLNLVGFSAVDHTKVDRSVVKWDVKRTASILESLWLTRNGLSMKYTVYTHRLIANLRRKFDRKGYSLRAQTELSKDTVVVWIAVKHRGNRPRRG